MNASASCGALRLIDERHLDLASACQSAYDVITRDLDEISAAESKSAAEPRNGDIMRIHVG
jgi:hypothetical protein